MGEDTPGKGFKDHFWGHNGFDELRRYIKGGGEFCKELAVILQERAELESTYAKGLHKLASKLVKASKDSLGSVHQAWLVVGQELDSEADAHRMLASSLAEEVTRPLRQLLDTQHKVRKGVEGMVDKTTRNVHEWRTAEFKAKKQSHSACRENEKIQDMSLEARLGRGKTLSEKEAVKMEKQRRKAEEMVQRSEVEYYTCSVRAERARLEWESAIYKGTTCFQTLEEERLAALKQLVEKYHQNIQVAAPKMTESVKRLEEPVSQCDVEKDVATIINAKGTGENIPHQLLPDFYPEDINNIMNRDRRRESLEKLNKMFRTDIDREKRGKQGVENLAKALQETPNFGSEDSQQDVHDKLQHMKAMLAYLEASRHKVQCSLADLEHRQRPSHVMERHVHTTRDKQGMMVSVLKVPAWLTPDSASPDNSPLSDSPAESPNWRDRGTADGTSVQPDSDFDEFSSQTSDREYQSALVNPQDMVTATELKVTSQAEKDEHMDTYDIQNPAPSNGEKVMGRCKALYDYDANMYDELTIRTGDIIQLHTKQPDGWWVGELNGTVGIFPATYVEEID